MSSWNGVMIENIFLFLWFLGIKPIPCNRCNSRFTTTAEMVRHVKYRHTHQVSISSTWTKNFCAAFLYLQFGKVISAQKLLVKCWWNWLQKPHKCSLCNYACVEASHLKRHMRYFETTFWSQIFVIALRTKIQRYWKSFKRKSNDRNNYQAD